MASRVFYLAPDFAPPSWGVGLLYEHVRLLREAGIEAWILHRRAPFTVEWASFDAPVLHLDTLAEEPDAKDLVVVPEVSVGEVPARWAAARAVFVQGSFLILGGDPAFRYPERGFDRGMAVLPHVADVVRRFFGLDTPVVPPFVAPEFFSAGAHDRPRRRRVLLSAKDAYRRIGFPDFDIVTALTRRHLAEGAPGWELVTLEGFEHRRVAELMGDAAFLVNLNTHEAFNTTVPEAMAAGCLPLCYEAVGGRDFLRDGVDAFVFPNHHAYDLAGGLFAAMARFDRGDPELTAMRERARQAARRFDVEATRRALVPLIRGWLAELASAV